MHGVRDPVDGVSVGYVFRTVHSVGQVRKESRQVLLPHAKWEQYMAARVKYGEKQSESKYVRHLEARAAWAQIAPEYAASIEPTLNEMLERWPK